MNESKIIFDAYALVKCSDVKYIYDKINSLYKDIHFEEKKYTLFSEAIKNFVRTRKATYNKVLIAQIDPIWSILIDDQDNSDGCYAILYN